MFSCGALGVCSTPSSALDSADDGVEKTPKALQENTVDLERYIALYFIYNMDLTKSSSNIIADNV